MEASVVAVEGDALLWYQWESSRQPVERWEEMKTLLLRQFWPTLSSVYQKGSVKDYKRRFIEVIASLTGIPEEIARDSSLKGQFIKRLKEEIRAEVRLLGPRNVDPVMELGGENFQGKDKWARAHEF